MHSILYCGGKGINGFPLSLGRFAALKCSVVRFSIVKHGLSGTKKELAQRFIFHHVAGLIVQGNYSNLLGF